MADTAAIFAIIVFVGDTYFRHRTNLDALAAPRPLDLGLEASMDSWCYRIGRWRQGDL